MARRGQAEGRPDGDASARDGDSARDADGARDADSARASIAVRLDDLLAAHGMTLTELADQVGITIVNLSILKNGRARAIRFTTLAGLCKALGCQPGDLLSYQPDGHTREDAADGEPPG